MKIGHKFIFIKAAIGSIFLFFLFTFIVPHNAKANAGLIQLRSVTGEEYRCFAASLIMPDKSYDVPVNCVNLIYPPLPPQISSYIMWATPASGKNPLKLGDLGRGEARFQIKQPFTSLFVTLEAAANVRTPSKNIIMTGGIEPISFLIRPTSPTPTLEPKKDDNQSTKTVDTSQLSTKDKLLLALRRAGIAAVVALVAIVGLIFVVTRSRG